MVSIDFVAVAILFGAGCLGVSLAPVIRLLQITRSPHLRRAWLWLAIMIVGFMVGYVILIGLLPRDMSRLIVNLICTILVMGGVFVFSVAILALRTASDVARLVRLEHEVVVDPLTGAYNRRYFDEAFSREVDLARRTASDFSLLVVDLDHFKQVNDTHGHAVGDKVLAVIAANLCDGIRCSDTLVRYGGEEFAIIAPATDKDEAALLAERLCQRIRGTDTKCPGGTSIATTVSIGLATLLPNESSDELFARADSALYAAKSGGRDRVVSDDAFVERRNCDSKVA